MQNMPMVCSLLSARETLRVWSFMIICDFIGSRIFSNFQEIVLELHFHYRLKCTHACGDAIYIKKNLIKIQYAYGDALRACPQAY